MAAEAHALRKKRIDLIFIFYFVTELKTFSLTFYKIFVFFLVFQWTSASKKKIRFFVFFFSFLQILSQGQENLKMNIS